MITVDLLTSVGTWNMEVRFLRNFISFSADKAENVEPQST